MTIWPCFICDSAASECGHRELDLLIWAKADRRITAEIERDNLAIRQALKPKPAGKRAA